jgi:hypothetical protein
MVRKQLATAHRPTSSKVTRSGFEKMRMSNERTRRDIKRILTERAKTKETGRPHHREQPYRGSR